MLTLKEQIVHVVSRLSDQQQQEVLDFVGSISSEDLELMEAAIEEGFEQVNLDEW